MTSQPTTPERITLNESRFREINDRVSQELSRLRHPPELLEFVCECGLLECRERIALARSEYERVRADPMLFAIVPGHELADVEDVVEQNDRFSVVRKRPQVEHLARATDPRRADRGAA